MRLLSRLHVCAGATILFILYFVWLQRSTYINNSIQTIWRAKTQRIVVFGDDWSDTGNYRVSPPPQSLKATRDPDRGDVWVETLCKELACDTIENFARSRPSETASVGSLIDSGVYAQASTGKSNGYRVTSFDFKTQVRQFLTYDKENHYIAERLRRVDERTIFTVFFGLWDLLEYSKLQREFAMRAIDNSLTELFQSLDALAEHAAGPIKVLLPSMVDVTFLPRFQSRRNATYEHFAENQHYLVFLRTYWNNVLFQTATQWKNGVVFMPDPNAVIMDQVRANQLHDRYILDASGNSKQAPLFEYVEQPCLSSKQGNSVTDLQAAAIEKCSDPAQHLFWDDLHLSGAAHRQIGRHSASLLRGNQSVNIEREMQGSANIARPEGQEGEGFKLKYPPGY
ncbi:Nn.00g093600.m01.CDS01 [Neocucurbitaria sp. VM-36]